MLARLINPTSCLGCANAASCPCKAAKQCLGCANTTCPNRAAAAPRPASLGDLSLSSIDWTSPTTLTVIALLALLLYQTLFRKEQRQKRSSRRTDLRSAEEKYRDDIKRIRERYAA